MPARARPLLFPLSRYPPFPIPSVARSLVPSFVGLGSIDSNLTRYLRAIRKNWGTEGRCFGRVTGYWNLLHVRKY